MLQKLISLILVFLSLGADTLDEYNRQMNPGGSLFLVNREYMISSAFVPSDLRKPDVRNASSNILLRDTAASALESMFQAALDEAGLQLVALSGYRSYSTQAAIHQRKVDAVGKKAALRVSAPPGASEHQLGLAMDLCTTYDSSLTERFADTPEGQWVEKNAFRFGFIIRYRGEWEEITGYAWEPWHIRYVGPEHARRLYDLNIPLEYYVMALKDDALQKLTED